MLELSSDEALLSEFLEKSMLGDTAHATALASWKQGELDGSNLGAPHKLGYPGRWCRFGMNQP